MIQRLTSLFDRRPRTAEAWLARLHGPRVSARDQAGFLAWLEQDDTHLALYEAAKADLAALSGLRSAFAGDLARLNGRRAPARSRRGLLAVGGLATAALVAAVLVWPTLRGAPRVEGVIYASPADQVMDVALADGSTATLDAGSVIRVSLADDARRVTLERGAAYFEVAHDAAHPFQVAVADRQVIVTGTRFVTALRRDRAEVSLLEGRVVISRHDVSDRRALAQAVKMTPGQQAEFVPGAASLTVKQADLEVATAWRKRRLVFHDAPLSVVMAQAEPYAGMRLVVADPALAGLRVTAVLPLTGDETLIDRMDALLPISVEKKADGRALIRAE
jgi:transmembrane sensor